MTNKDIHSCSYFCTKPECIKQQRDDLREKCAGLEALAQGRLEQMQSDRKQYLDYRDRVEGRLK